MAEQIIIQIPDDNTGSKLIEFLKKLNLPYSISSDDDSISDEEKEYVLDILHNTLEEDYISYDEVKKQVLKNLPRK